ncbi:hypothetical protein [Mesorhizobium sp. B4-1-4]|uniref:hypothetical protein n=1 Tax=Mesorhizobium sp. B4-1-4 TaxID=2589888 RepID=UPI00112A9856|nr:hypothetical protein [Mesorhizobium sp. B4-1-4]UCI32147.1 hypothetical protein FJW03_01405 [Mesorhizobium sp. B4-1-4]
MSYNAKQHSYEEIREAIVDIVVRPNDPPRQWASLISELADEFARREGGAPAGARVSHGANSLHPFDTELARDAFWDLFRQGMITLGLNDYNPAWPWFRVSHLGRQELAAQSPLRFYDSGTFIALVKKQVPDISDEALIYLREAAGAFYASLLLSACVMVGVAAEAEFTRLVEVAATHPDHGSRFNSAQKAEFIGSKVEKFRRAIDTIKSDLPKSVVENLEVVWTIQTVIRTARNDAGHPVATTVTRQQVYVYLQLFVDMARQMMLLRQELTSLAPST